ncbi:hypothetical protein CYG49_02745 [Candidatus Saccharibacteria bacterium]|nr:MAG: hypothetical protein CYG49_02745 [Candidatus Saccharibacteria bacterium]
MSFRTVLSVITLLAIIAILFFARQELVTAWNLLWNVDLWILSLLIPVQFISFFAVGAMIFEYLRKQDELKDTSKFQTARMALELNFVNHALPSGGVSGVSYMAWRLKHYGVKAGRATMAQVVRFVVTFAAYLVLLLISIIVITIDGSINRFSVLISSALATAIILGTIFGIYIIRSQAQLHAFSRSLTRGINKLGRRFTKREQLVQEKTIEYFFTDLHQDYLILQRNKGLLKKPLIWAFVFNIAEISMFVIAYAALGVYVNPAIIIIAYGVATVAGIFSITPGGAGAYEAIMISFLVGAGAPYGATIAAILLTRVILIVGTIISGYIFYQHSLVKYGKQPAVR